MTPWLSRVCFAASVVGAFSAALWVWTGWPSEMQPLATTIATTDSVETSDASSEEAAVPPQVLSVTLHDDLHPEPPAPEPEKARKELPRLDVRVIAIRSVADQRTAFVHDASQGAYIDLFVGDTLASGARVVRVTESSVVFEYDGREVPVELPQR